MKKIYVDNSSTSFPKAPGLADVISRFINETGCNVNRGGYTDSYDVALEILETRQLLADMFHTSDPQGVIFTPSVTYSLNMLLQGYLKENDHVITTSMEHNSVMRPLQLLLKRGITYDIAHCDINGCLNPESITKLIKNETKAIVMTHASNVCGTVLPIEKVSEICREKRIRLIVDAAQTAGVLDIDSNGIDALAFTGHKGLLGPQGIGGFVIKKDFAAEIDPLIVGGTGSKSDIFDQPDMLPDKFESGTMNIPAIIGLKKSVEYINSVGMNKIYEKESSLASLFVSEMRNIGNINIAGIAGVTENVYTEKSRIAVVSLDFRNLDNALIAAKLDEDYGIMTRCGLHCAPLAHKTLGTYPQGTIRFSFGYFNTPQDVEYISNAVKSIIKAI